MANKTTQIVREAMRIVSKDVRLPKVVREGIVKKQTTNTMSNFKQYKRKQIAELRPYQEGEQLSDRVSISPADKDAGSPKIGDMIARNPKNHDDQWLVAKTYFEDNFESAESNSNTVEVSKEFLQNLIGNFYAVCDLADELNIYEHESMDNNMQSMKAWTEENFERTINKKQYGVPTTV
jgi:alpha-L-fucosidase